MQSKRFAMLVENNNRAISKHEDWGRNRENVNLYKVSRNLLQIPSIEEDDFVIDRTDIWISKTTSSFHLAAGVRTDVDEIWTTQEN